MQPTSTQINFCRLTGITEFQYQTLVFEYGCGFAESYWKKFPVKDKEFHVRVMLSLPEYWNWWSTQWNIRTQESLGVVGIEETESALTETEQCALIEAFEDTHNLKTFTYIYPNQWVFKAFKDKLYGNQSNKQQEHKKSQRIRTRRPRISAKL